VSWIKHSVDRFVIVSIFIPKLRLILILNSFLGSSDSLVFSELFHSLAPRPLAARSISEDGKSGSAGMTRPISYAVFCLKKKNKIGRRVHGQRSSRRQLIENQLDGAEGYYTVRIQCSFGIY